MMMQDININIGTSFKDTANNFTPYRIVNNKNKVQFILTTSELSSFGIAQGQLIHALYLKSAEQPDRSLQNFRIRVGQTDKTVLTKWETNLTLVWEGTVSKNELVANTSKKYNFIIPYTIGEGNLLIEISRDETSWHASGGMWTRTGFANGKMIGWRKDNGSSFPFDDVEVTQLNFILDVILTVEEPEEVKGYKLNGSYETPLIISDNPFCIKWVEDKPTDTNIIIEYATEENPTIWNIVSNEEIINTNSNICFRVNLSTTDNTKTPKLLDLWLENIATQDKILITMKGLKRFNNVEGDLEIVYNQKLGNLKGLSGIVKSFNKYFTPTDLVQELNPWIREYLTANFDADIELKEIRFISNSNTEYLKANFDADVKLWKVEDAPI